MASGVPPRASTAGPAAGHVVGVAAGDRSGELAAVRRPRGDVRPERKPALIRVTRSGPQRQPSAARRVATGAEWIGAVAEEDLRAVDVADPATTAWSMGSPPIGRPAAGDAGVGPARRRDGARSRSRAEPAWMASTSEGLSTSHAVGPRRSVHPGLGDPTHAHRSPCGAGGSPGLPDRARTARGGRARCGRRIRGRGRCLAVGRHGVEPRPSTRSASVKRPCGLVTSIEARRRTGPAGRAPSGAGC